MRYAVCMLSGIVCGMLCLGALTLLAEDNPSQGLCEANVRDTYQTLVTEQLVPSDPTLTWGQQLMAITRKLRLLQTQYGLRRQQADQQATQAESTIADLVDQQRALQQRLMQTLQAQQQPAPQAIPQPPAAAAPAEPAVPKTP